MKKISIAEFKPTIFFLLKFLGLYLVTNLAYGYYITSFESKPDPVTRVVAQQTAFVLATTGEQAVALDSPTKPTTSIVSEGRGIIAVYEGCNGINTMIIFIAFVIAFGPLLRTTFWFILIGMLVIHLVNLARVALLFVVSKYLHQYLYFTHKYFFTAILYFVVLILWFVWVRYFTVKKA
jgi:exosortase family protein XrtF